MAADRPLAIDDQGAGHDIGPLDRDGDGQLLIGAGHEVVGPHADALAAQDIHGVIDHDAGALGDVILGDGRQNRGTLALVQGRHAELAHGVGGIGMARHPRQGFLDPLEAADGGVELAADGDIGPGHAHGQLGHADIGRRQGNGAPGRQALHQHPPAVAHLPSPANDHAERDEHVLALGRAILEDGIDRPVPTPDLDARMVARDHHAGDARLGLVSQQPVRIDSPERQADQGRDGGQGDVALLPADAETQGRLALPHLAADHAGVGDRGGIGPGIGIGQGKAGNLLPPRQSRQIMVLLGLGAIVEQQLGRPQGVGHHDRHGRGRAPRRQLLDHLAVGIGREAQAAIGLGDDHAQETLVARIGPGLGRQVLPDRGGFPVIGQVAQVLGLVIEEGLFLGSQAGGRRLHQPRPVRATRKQLGIPPHAPGLDGRRFRGAHPRHNLAEQAHGGR